MIAVTQPDPVTVDDVLDLELSGRSQSEIAQTLVEWSANAGSDEFLEYSPASLLVTAAEHLDMGGLDGADELLNRAERSAGHEQIDFFEARVAHAFATGDTAVALKLEEASRRTQVRRYQTYEMMADILNANGHYERALRWANIGLRHLDDNPDADAAYEDLLIVRYRMRRDQQAAIDGYDQEAELILAERDGRADEDRLLPES
jgi:hypothetical protein